MIICNRCETDFDMKKRMAVSKRIKGLQDMLQGHEKCIFETPDNEIKCVLGIKESNFNGKMGQHFHICLRSRAEREFPFPVIPGDTSLKFPVPSLPVAF